MPFSALAPRGAFADVRRAFTYNCSSDFCDGVLPKLKDSVFFSLRPRRALVARAVRHAFDTWSYNSDLRFAQVDGDADFYLLAQDLNHDADGHVLGQAYVPAAPQAYDAPLPIFVSSEHCWYQYRQFCHPVLRHGAALSVVAGLVWAPAAIFVASVACWRATLTPLGAALRILAWVGFLGVPLALVAGLPCWACFDFETVVTHEVGHALGLGHADGSGHWQPRCGCWYRLRGDDAEARSCSVRRRSSSPSRGRRPGAHVPLE